MNIPIRDSARARHRAVRHLETAVEKEPDQHLLNVASGAFLGALIGTVAVITGDVAAPVLAVLACALIAGLAGWALDARRRRDPHA